MSAIKRTNETPALRLSRLHTLHTINDKPIVRIVPIEAGVIPNNPFGCVRPYSIPLSGFRQERETDHGDVGERRRNNQRVLSSRLSNCRSKREYHGVNNKRANQARQKFFDGIKRI